MSVERAGPCRLDGVEGIGCANRTKAAGTTMYRLSGEVVLDSGTDELFGKVGETVLYEGPLYDAETGQTRKASLHVTIRDPGPRVRFVAGREPRD